MNKETNAYFILLSGFFFFFQVLLCRLKLEMLLRKTVIAGLRENEGHEVNYEELDAPRAADARSVPWAPQQPRRAHTTQRAAGALPAPYEGNYAELPSGC